MKDVFIYLLLFFVCIAPFSLVKLDRHVLETRVEEGRALMLQGAFNEAALVFDSVIARDPDDYRGYCGRAEALYRLGNIKGSLDALERAIDLIDLQDAGSYQEADHHFRVAHCSMAAHDYQKALIALKHSVYFDHGKQHYDSYLKQLQRVVDEDGEL